MTKSKKVNCAVCGTGRSNVCFDCSVKIVGEMADAIRRNKARARCNVTLGAADHTDCHESSVCRSKERV